MEEKVVPVEPTKLEPCPFCGGEAGVLRHSGEAWEPEVIAYCKTCGAKVSDQHHEDPIRLWNTRAAPPTPGEVGALRPIESAPKDGTKIDLFWPNGYRLPDCFWGLPGNHYCEAGQYCDHDVMREPGWVDSMTDMPVGEAWPTHWAPIPSPSSAAPEVGALVEALRWYAVQGAGCRKVTSEGEAARYELDRDGGKRARAALALVEAQPQ